MIYHIIGTRHSGKSYLIKKVLKSTNNFVKWDVLVDFYQPLDILDNNSQMNFNTYYKYESYLSFALELFIKQNKNKYILLESSGLNKNINKFLKQYESKPVILKTPSDEELSIRAEKTQQNIEDILTFKTLFEKNMRPIIRYYDLKTYLCYEAIDYITKGEDK